MPRLGAVDFLKHALARLGLKARQDTDVENALVEETLYYSQRGSIAIPEMLVEQIKADGGDVLLGSAATHLHQANGKVVAVACGGQRLDCDRVITTVPITRVISMFDPPPPVQVAAAASRLQFRPLVVYGLVINRPRVLDALYVYYRDSVFHRIAEPTQSGLKPNPPDHAVLLVEITCTIGDETWNDSTPARHKMIADLEREGVVRREEIVQLHHQRTEFGYPVFDLDFDRHLVTIQDYLRSVSNVDSIGRQGGFCYPNMHQTMRFGADAAAKLITDLQSKPGC